MMPSNRKQQEEESKTNPFKEVASAKMAAKMTFVLLP
jgi:hypothetical protein